MSKKRPRKAPVRKVHRKKSVARKKPSHTFRRQPKTYYRSRKSNKPLWGWHKGITYSALSLWLSCPEQFALAYMEGWTPKKLSIPLEFGSLWHLCQEHQFRSSSPEKVVRDVTTFYQKTRLPTLLPEDRGELERLLIIVERLFPFYCERYHKEDTTYKWIGRERSFRVKHHFLLPGNKAPASYTRSEGGVLIPIHLKGKRDGEFRSGKGNLRLFETKTRSQINHREIADLLRADLQTLLYCYSLLLEYREYPDKILYNVVKRPGERLGKAETIKTYGDRILNNAKKNPSAYFARFDVTVLSSDLDRFVSRILDPTLRNFYRWWRTIKPKNPTEGGGEEPLSRWNSPYHFQNLNALQNKYGRCHLYDLMIMGNTNRYYRRSSLFPELDS